MIAPVTSRTIIPCLASSEIARSHRALETVSSPLGALPTDEDCANAILFLASDLARAITGATLDVNGGTWMP